MTVYDFSYSSNSDSTPGSASRNRDRLNASTIGLSKSSFDQGFARSRTFSTPLSSRTDMSQSARATSLSALSHPLLASNTKSDNIGGYSASPIHSGTYYGLGSLTLFPGVPSRMQTTPVLPFLENDRFSTLSPQFEGSRERHSSSKGRLQESISPMSTQRSLDSAFPRASPPILEFPGGTHGTLTPLDISPNIPLAIFSRVELDKSGSLQNIHRSSSTSLLRKINETSATPRSRQAVTLGHNTGRLSVNTRPVIEIPTEFRSPFRSSGGEIKPSTVSFHNNGGTAYSYGPNHRSNPQPSARRLPRPVDLTPDANFHRETIDFRVNGISGIRVKDLLDGHVVVDDGSMAMFANHSWRKTLFALHWPGYEESSLPIHLRAKEVDGRRITRQMLAIDIAQKIQDFMDPRIQQYALRKGCPDDQWRVAKYDGHVLSDVILTALHLYKRVWVPDLYVEW